MMNTKAILLLPFFGLALAGCGEENEAGRIPYTGTWTNKQNETLTIEPGNSFLHFEAPGTFILYDYYLKNDSIFLFPTHSSNLNDWEGYPFECNNQMIIIYGFRGEAKNIFAK